MKNSIDLKRCLSVFNIIIEKGDKRGSEFEYHGIYAWHDFDGYTCFMKYKQMTLSLFFHGKYDITFDNESDLHEFEKKLIKIEQEAQ